MSQLFGAILNPSGPNYDRLKECFGEGLVPLKSALKIKARLGDEHDVPVYMLDFAAMPLNQRARLFGMIAQKFGVLVADVERTATKEGFPIREADVIVSFSMRAFI